jgi:hypothetical protein
MNEYELGTTVRLTSEFRDLDNELIDPTTVTLTIDRPDGTVVSVIPVNNPSIGSYNANYTTTVTGEHAYTWKGDTPSINFVDIQSDFFSVVDYSVTGVDTMIPTLRMYLGDLTDPYRFTTYALRAALVFAVKALMRRWRSKYKIEDNSTVIRNPNYTFEFAAPPTIQVYDEPAIVVQAAIIIKTGIMQEASWQIGSWRDDEIAVSNIEGSRSRDRGLDRDIAWLDDFFKRRLYTINKQSLPGFNYPPNWYEG